MAKSQSISEIFEECLELVINGSSIEECLRRYPQHAGELKGLLETAMAARKSVAVQPSEEFQVRSRLQLQAALNERALRPKNTGWLRWSWQPGWAVAAVAVLLVMITGCGTVLAAETSMPGQPLYAVKRTAEQLRLAVATSPVKKAKLNAVLADRRVNEIIYLAAKGDAGDLLDTAEALNSNLLQLSNIAGQPGDATPAPERNMFGAGEQLAAATAVPETFGSQDILSAPAPAPVTQPAPETVATFNINKSAGKQAWSNIQVAVPPNASKAEIERAKLVAWLKYLAVHHPALLKETLAVAPEDTRTALMQAIAISETGYERVLQSLEAAP